MVSFKSNWSKISQMMKSKFIQDRVSFKSNWSKVGFRKTSSNWTRSHLILNVLKTFGWRMISLCCIRFHLNLNYRDDKEPVYICYGVI